MKSGAWIFVVGGNIPKAILNAKGIYMPYFGEKKVESLWKILMQLCDVEMLG